MNNNSIKISIITICYNAERLIENTIMSVIGQEYDKIEYIIVDGNSKDNTLYIVKKYSKYIDALISENDRGISDAFNKGLRIAKGDIVCFLNAGDVFISNTILSRVANDFLNNTEIDVLFYKMRYGVNGITPPDKYNNDAKRIWENMAIPHQACFCRTSLFEDVGNFNLLLKIRMDYEFFARCVRLNIPYKYIPEVITLYDDTGVSSDPANAYQFLHEGILIKNLYGFPVPLKEKLRCLKWWFFCKHQESNSVKKEIPNGSK